MLQLSGPPAFSPSALAKKLAAVRRGNPRVHELSAEFVHFADVDRPLEPSAHAVLEQLLRYGPRRERIALDGTRLLVVPRIGTISPWSSKATDIARNCGLAQVRRVERGVLYVAVGTVDDSAALAASLHDRMTE